MFTGPHCEFLVLESNVSKLPNIGVSERRHDGRRPGLVLLIVFVVASVLVLLMFIARQVKRIYKRKEGDTINLQGFRDDNIAVSPNGSMLFPAFSPGDSFNKAGRRRSRRNHRFT